MTQDSVTYKSDQPPRSKLLLLENIHGWPTQSIQELQRRTADALCMPIVFRDALNPLDLGPEMVVIPAGAFLMGPSAEEIAPKQKEEFPQHMVTFAKPFAIGKYPVTFEELDCFCLAIKRRSPYGCDQGWGRGRRPVINISWATAQVYCAWLTKQTGYRYRLPSESEWEYACRAGSTTAFHWGSTITPKQANYDGNHSYCNGEKGQFRKRTLPVDYAFPINAFSLHQMIGNVWEWCEDRWHGGYNGAPSDGSPWTTGVSENCVIRGGSWYSGPNWLRSASRAWWPSNGMDEHIGFRLARDISIYSGY